MGDRLEITLRITLDRPGLEKLWKRAVENDTAFYVLGLVHAQLTSTFGDDTCTVDMESATGLDTAFVRSMNSFARRHKRALDTLDAQGEVLIEDRDLLEVFQVLHDVVITPIGSRWRVSRVTLPAEALIGGSSPKN